jgi:hypothetical protein
VVRAVATEDFGRCHGANVTPYRRDVSTRKRVTLFTTLGVVKRYLTPHNGDMSHYYEPQEPANQEAWEQFEELQADNELPEYDDTEAGFEVWLRDMEDAAVEAKHDL